jgi:hypothetical protein
LPIPGRKPYATADEAAAELRQLAARDRHRPLPRRPRLVRRRHEPPPRGDRNVRRLVRPERDRAEPIAASEYDLTFDEDVTVAATDDEELVILSAEDEEPVFVAEEPIAADENAISFELLEAFVTETPAEEDPSQSLNPPTSRSPSPSTSRSPSPSTSPSRSPSRLRTRGRSPEPVYEPIAEPVYEPEPIVEPAYEPEPIPEYVAEIEPELERAYEPIEAPIEPVPEELVARSETSIPPASPDENARTLVGAIR